MTFESLTSKALSAVAIIACSGIAFAGTVSTFSNRLSFNATVGATTTEDFTSTSHFPIPGGILSSTTSFGSLAAGTIKTGATYTSPVGSGNYFNIDAGGGFSGGFLDGFNPSTRDLTIAYSPLVFAFGFDTNNLMPNFDITINFSTGGSYVNNFSANNSGFFGFQSTVADISSVVISGNNSFFGFAIDNHSFGGIAAQSQNVPEPKTIALVGLALAGLALNCRKAKQA